jgi:hypothetical protein
MNREKLSIEKGGRLIQIKWIYDEETGDGSYQEFDRTENIIPYLFDNCELADDNILRDIFTLMYRHINFLDVLLGNWCFEIVDEGLTQPAKPYIKGDEEIEYLELYYQCIYAKDREFGNDLCGMKRPEFHGIGFEREQDSYFDWVNRDGTRDIEWKKGDRAPWVVSLSKANDLINVPVKLRNTLEIYEEDCNKSPRCNVHKVVEFENPVYTLLDIFYGIIWVLRFYGGPKDRDKMSNQLTKQVNNIRKEPTE